MSEGYYYDESRTKGLTKSEDAQVHERRMELSDARSRARQLSKRTGAMTIEGFDLSTSKGRSQFNDFIEQDPHVSSARVRAEATEAILDRRAANRRAIDRQVAEKEARKERGAFVDEQGHLNVTWVRPYSRRGPGRPTDVRGHERIVNSGITPLPDGVSYVGYVRFADGSAFESRPGSERETRRWVRRNGGTLRE